MKLNKRKENHLDQNRALTNKIVNPEIGFTSKKVKFTKPTLSEDTGWSAEPC